MPSATDAPVPVWHPSPNFGPRRDGLGPELIVLHYTAMGSAQAALDRLCDLDAQVSAHYLIGSDGTVWQMVKEPMRAWHAGAGAWRGQDDINSRSIGIELDNSGSHPFSHPQMAALESLLRDIMARWDIVPAGVIAHSDMAPDRKSDPGPRFDWRRLALQGLAVWPDPEPDGDGSADHDFLTDAAGFGYPVKDGDAALAAFRSRFRPHEEGPQTDADRVAIRDLAQRFGVDPDDRST